MRFVIGVAVFVGVMATADFLFAIDPTFGESMALVLATTLMLLVQES